jgi:multiple sugar transport system substrate-binding protein
MLAILAGSASFMTGCKKYDLTVFIFAQPSETEIYQQLVDEFQEAEGVTVNYSTGGDEYFVSLDSKLTANIPPDVYYVRPGDVRMRVNLKQVQPLDSIVSQEELDAMWPQAVDAFRYDGASNGTGALYALPKDYSQYALGFNQVLIDRFRAKIEPFVFSPAKEGHSSFGKTFAQWEGGPALEIKAIVDGERADTAWTLAAGFKLPGWPGDVIDGNQVVYTFDEFGLLSYLCTSPNPNSTASNFYGTQFWESMCLDSYIWGGGGEWFAQKADGALDYTKLATDSAAFVAAQESYMELAYKWWSVQLGQVSGSGYENFQQGTLAFLPVGTWDVAQFGTLSKSLVQYHLMPWPVSNAYAGATLADRQDKWFARADTVGYGVSSNCKSKDLAARFVRWLTTNIDNQQLLAAKGAQIPNVREYAQTEYLNNSALYPLLSKNDKQILLRIAETNGKRVPTVFTYNDDWRVEFLSEAASNLWAYDANDRETVASYAARMTPRAQAKLDAAVQLEEDQKPK